LRDQKLSRTRQLLDELDPHVLAKLKNIENKLPESFSRYDKDMMDLLENYSRIHAVEFQTDREQKDGEQIFLRFDDKPYYIGKRDEDKIRNYQHISLKNPVMEEIVRNVRSEIDGKTISGVFDTSGLTNGINALSPYAGKYGRWDFYNVRFSGVEEEEHLFDIIAVDSQDSQAPKFLNDVETDALKSLDIFPDDSISQSIDDPLMEDFLRRKIDEKSFVLQNAQQPRLNKKLHNLEVELRDMEEFLNNKEKEIREKMEEVDKKIANTLDRETGLKLIKEKGELQNEMKSIRKELLKFQDEFQDMYGKEELKLIEKRFIKDAPRCIFTLHFKIN